MNGTGSDLEAVLAAAVERSGSIAEVWIQEGALAGVPEQLCRHLGKRPWLLVTDEITWQIAGQALAAELQRAELSVEYQIFSASPRLRPTMENGEQLRSRLLSGDRFPIAVGAGVINDLTKYAAFASGRPYVCVPTAASMDGYASAGSVLSQGGFKITHSCAPPYLLAIDLSLLAAAPKSMAGWGYGDLAGKVPAGADWLVADALGLEPIDQVAWPLVQDHLHLCLSGPEGLPQGNPKAIRGLLIGLLLTGLAMEFHGTSRPASGADHQIAHLWEMEHHTYQGEPVSHGACVAVGCLATLALYDWLLRQSFVELTQPTVLTRYPTLQAKEQEIEQSFSHPEIIRRAKLETQAKHCEPMQLAKRLSTLHRQWSQLQIRLQSHLIPTEELTRLLRSAGAPTTAAEIGVTPEHLRRTIRSARFIRSRYTILDLLEEVGMLEQALQEADLPYR